MRQSDRSQLLYAILYPIIAVRRALGGRRFSVLVILCVLTLTFVLSQWSLGIQLSFPSLQGTLKESDKPAGTWRDWMATQKLPPPMPMFQIDGTVVGSWEEENQHQLNSLQSCLNDDTACWPNQKNIIIVVENFFQDFPRYIGGENIWARSTLIGLKRAGYTYLHARHMHNIYELYSHHPSLVKAVIIDLESYNHCVAPLTSNSPVSTLIPCLKTEAQLDGVPLWKLFHMYFWNDPAHVLDRRWVLAPENYYANNQLRRGRGADLSSLYNLTYAEPPLPPIMQLESNQYLGYSVEPSCLAIPFVPHSSRPFNDNANANAKQAYVLSKRYSYFTTGLPHVAWPLSFYDAAQKATGVQFIAGAMHDHDDPSMVEYVDKARVELGKMGVRVGSIPEEFPASIRDLGLAGQEEFIGRIAESSVLVGVGAPAISPTPYEALCLGVPFINPILRWDPNNPSDRTHWETQHATLQHLGPPYVYHVHKDNQEEFVDAVRMALKNPIERTILPEMTLDAVEQRLRNILAVDWRAEAKKILEERKRSGAGTVFLL